MRRKAAGAWDRAGLESQVRQGDELALLAWADLLEEQGDGEAAAALRGWTGLAGLLQRESAALLSRDPQREPIAVYLAERTRDEWLCQGRCAYVTGNARAIAAVLDAPDGLLPAVEWLARRLGLMLVEVVSCGPGWTLYAGDGEGVEFPLHQGHTVRLPAGSYVVRVTLRPSETVGMRQAS
jgi:hypothetical protein